MESVGPSDAGNTDRCIRCAGCAAAPVRRSRGWLRYTVHDAFAVPAKQAALARDDHLRRTFAQHFTDERFIGAEAVERRGVEMRHAEVERALDHALSNVARLWRPIGMRQVHAAETHRGDFERSELAELHWGLFQTREHPTDVALEDLLLVGGRQ